MKKTKVGFIGCGGIANYHLGHLLEFEDVQIVALADPIKERRENFAKKTGAERLYNSHKELFENEDNKSLDCVYICVEPTAHTDIEYIAVEKGIPFLIEKPIHLDLREAEKISHLIIEKNLITSVGFQDRYLEIIDKLKDELKNRKCGLVYGAWVGGIPMVWWWLRKETCGGQLVEQNIHLLDMLRYLFGEPTSVYATASRGLVEPFEKDGVLYDTDDHSTCVIGFKNNVTATLFTGCYMNYNMGGFTHNGLTILCDDMTIEYNLRDDVTFLTKESKLTYNRLVDQGILADRTFIDAVKTGDDSKIRSPYSDALKTLRLGLAANESMETGQAIYF
ncbi:MAG: Gfo/Idh/MocA family oxidoreductase [Oscillospiraceae bacterium]|nr:Gfo/Idh/MocA family oxidoreductase [Oscillospiraceae bacterium]